MSPETNKLRSGRKRCMINSTALTSRMNMPSTDITVFQVVVLRGLAYCL